MTRYPMLLMSFVMVSACQSTQSSCAGDEAITRVDECVCYKAGEGQQKEPWKLAWNDSDKLRQQLSHCVCQTYIDPKKVKDPARYAVPGTVIK
ncbi:hypothetical protein D9M71_315470 [compost metagenome]